MPGTGSAACPEILPALLWDRACRPVAGTPCRERVPSWPCPGAQTWAAVTFLVRRQRHRCWCSAPGFRPQEEQPCGGTWPRRLSGDGPRNLTPEPLLDPRPHSSILISDCSPILSKPFLLHLRTCTVWDDFSGSSGAPPRRTLEPAGGLFPSQIWRPLRQDQAEQRLPVNRVHKTE